MFRPRIIPVLLIDGNGSAVKTIRFRKKVYLGDPVNAVSIFNSFRVDELVLLDIAGSKEGRAIPLPLLHDIASEAKMPFAVGGGVSTLEDIHKVLAAGAEKVVLSTAALEEPTFVRLASERYGSSSIVVCIDVGKNIFGRQTVRTRGGTRKLDMSPTDAALLMEKSGAGELILQSIDRDGEMCGYDLELIEVVSRAVSIPVIALGGAGNLNDMKIAHEQTHASAFASGSAFCFQDRQRGVLINYPTKAALRTFRNSLGDLARERA